MTRSADWNLSKGVRLSVNLVIAGLIAYVVPRYYSPFTETLLLVSIEKHILYCLWFGFSFLIFGEMVGIADRKLLNPSTRHFFLFLLSGSLASLSLLLIVWVIEYSFVGRFAILKIACFTGIGSFLFFAVFGRLARQSRTRVFLMVSDEVSKLIQSSLNEQTGLFEWVDRDALDSVSDFREFCNKETIDLVVMDKSPEAGEIEIIPLLEGGTQVMGVVEFWEQYLEKIPPRHVDQSWLAKLDLRLRDPFSHKLKRLTDLVLGFLGIVLSLPILLPALVIIAIDSGFPLFFTQQRTGFMGRPYTLFKLRTMERNAEKKGAEWAKEKDSRVTRCGKFLRKWRIDEIPQFLNVIKGEMSIVGPRPERPEFQEDLIKQVPHWNCRHLVKPGLTGWAQIRYRYAADADASEEKLAYDLYYIKHASTLVDLQIILSTLRSIAQGSR